MKKIVFLSLGLFFCLCSHAQDNFFALGDDDSATRLLQLPLEQLMDIPIYSASKTEESTFDAPVSSTVITRDQIKRAGATSIMEALRLAPGVIVREQTNGSYDIHIQGLDNIPPNSSLIFFTNSTALVMIDSRPVYNYLHGGTFWETLPVTLAEVERIEVVRGACSALYGPNAVSGVINIITRKPEKEGIYSSAGAQYGSYKSLIADAALGNKFNDKVSVWVTGNFQRRDRTQSDYYDVVTNSYVPIDSVTAIRRAAITNPSIISTAYPDPNLAMYRYGANGYIKYDPSDRVHLSMALGAQNSEVQNEFAAGLASITTASSATRYGYLYGDIYGFNVQLSHNGGTEAPALGQTIWKWDLNTSDAMVEYNFNKIKHLSIRPGIYYRRAVYDDSKYINAAAHEGFWSGEAISETKAASLRLDYRLLDDKLRLVAAGRVDKFNYPGKSYLSYQFAATYKINENNLVRISESRSNRTPLLIDIYSNLDLKGPLPLTNPSQTYLFQLRGNKDIRLLTTDMTTIGYRSKLSSSIQIDIEGFYSRTKDFSNIVFESGSFDSTGPVSFTGLLQFDNLSVHTQQYGATMALEYIRDRWQFRPYFTIQKTYLLDYSQYDNAPGAPALSSNNNNPALYNIYYNKGSKIEHIGTPSSFGGMYVNYELNKKWNFNVNGYFFTTYTQLESSNLTYNDGQRGVQKVPAKLLLNVAAMYKVSKQVSVSATVRNLLNDSAVEFYKGDAPALMVFGKVNFEL